MPTIRLIGISNFVLKNITLTINNNSVHVIIGPNGAGKTTLLKVIAGLVRYKGHVYFDNTIIDQVPVWKRNIGYVPQNNALFPHMTVLENILFGLRNKGLDSNEAYKVAKHYMEQLGILDLKDKYPLKLSSGEQKKVALARALAIEPEILLLDEPFTGLHYDYRVSLYETIRKIYSERKTTIVLVTHNIDEALRLGSRYTILVEGRNVYTGGLKDLFENMEKYLSYINIFKCKIIMVDEDNEIAKVKCQDLELVIPFNVKCSKNVIVAIPFDKIIVYRSGECYPKINCFHGIVEDIINNRVRHVIVRIHNKKIKVLSNTLSPGEKIMLKIPVKDIKIFCTD